MAATLNHRGLTVLATVLENMKRNVITGIENAQKSGVQCSMPQSIEVDMALDYNGLPCFGDKPEAARIKTTIILRAAT